MSIKETVTELLSLYDARNADSESPETALTEAPRAGGLRKDPILARQGSDEDQDKFIDAYDQYGLLKPPWNPSACRQVFEESDLVGCCIRCYLANIVRPYGFEYVGPKGEKDGEASQRNLRRLQELFRFANDRQSFYRIAEKLWHDRLMCGNGYMEVLPDPRTNTPRYFYHVPATYMRVTETDERPIPIYVDMPQDGELKPVVLYRRFRRFARVWPSGRIEWFKEFGDPRILDRTKGEYVLDSQGRFLREPHQYFNKATEIWWFRDPVAGSTYGVPMWVSALFSVRGRFLAEWVNYDTLDHGGAPPWLLLIYGKLAKGTRKYLMRLIQKWRDPSAYSDPGVLEIEPNLLSFNSPGGSKAGAEFISLRDMRTEEGMFRSYRQETRETISQVFRLPPILIGSTEGQTNATAYAAIEIAETQVFGPIKWAWDERINRELIKGRLGIYDWEVKTKASPIGDKEQLYRAIGMAGRTGGPSINQLLRIQNEVLGTKWQEYDGPFYNDITAAEAIALVRQGLVTYDPETFKVTAVNPQGAPGAGQAEKQDNAPDTGNLTADALHKLGPLAASITLLRAMQEVEQAVEDYEPPDVGEDDYVQ